MARKYTLFEIYEVFISPLAFARRLEKEHNTLGIRIGTAGALIGFIGCGPIFVYIKIFGRSDLLKIIAACIVGFAWVLCVVGAIIHLYTCLLYTSRCV